MVLEHLRALREDQDLKQRQMAEFLSVHQTTYSDYELGNIDIPLDSLCQLADYFNTSTDYLLGRTDEKKPYPKKRKR